jgi:hypothetical protein
VNRRTLSAIPSEATPLPPRRGLITSKCRTTRPKQRNKSDLLNGDGCRQHLVKDAQPATGDPLLIPVPEMLSNGEPKLPRPSPALFLKAWRSSLANRADRTPARARSINPRRRAPSSAPLRSHGGGPRRGHAKPSFLANVSRLPSPFLSSAVSQKLANLEFSRRTRPRKKRR